MRFTYSRASAGAFMVVLLIVVISPILALGATAPATPEPAPTPTPANDNQPAIIGGTLVQEGEHPWMVSVGSAPVVDGSGQVLLSQFCGGSLITENWVLTAAHCFFDPATGQQNIFAADVQLFLGGLDWTFDTPNSQRIDVKRIIIHEAYDVASFTNDIALLELTEPANLQSPTIDIIPLMTGAKEPGLVAPGMTATVAGWGKTTSPGGESSLELLKVDLPIVANEQCKPFGDAEMMGIPDTQVCAGGAEQQDSCQGDSGGPLIVSDAGSFLQVGLVSYGPAVCGQADMHAAYTRVSHYRDWIETQIGRALPDAKTPTPTATTAPPTPTATTAPPTPTATTAPPTPTATTTPLTTAPTTAVPTTAAPTTAAPTSTPTQAPGDTPDIISFAPTIPTTGDLVSFVIAVEQSAEGDYVELDFGDGNRAILRVVDASAILDQTLTFTHTYTTGGQYTVTARITSDISEHITATTTITVNARGVSEETPLPTSAPDPGDTSTPPPVGSEMLYLPVLPGRAVVQ